MLYVQCYIQFIGYNTSLPAPAQQQYKQFLTDLIRMLSHITSRQPLYIRNFYKADMISIYA